MKVGREFDSSLSILKEENSALQALMSEELEKRKTIIKELMD